MARRVAARRGAPAALLIALAAQGCNPPGPDPEPPAPQWIAEQALLEVYDGTPLAVSGRVVDGSGVAVPAAQVALGDLETATDATGTWALEGVARANALLTVSAAGFRDQVHAARLAVPLAAAELELPTVALASEEGTRFLYTGDVMLGRRYLDPSDTTAPDRIPLHPDAVVRSTHADVDSRAAVSWIEPVFATADFPVANLESVVTAVPATPHPTKDFVYFTLPGSLDALHALGIRYVGLGNNHLYDYLEDGVADTLAHLEEADIASSGAGPSSAAAWTPWRTELGGHTYAFIAANTIAGDEHEHTYNATPGKGGAADARDTALLEAIVAQELAGGAVPIVQIHSGLEYTYAPSGYTRSRYDAAGAAGAAVVVGNHPHISQGFGRTTGGALAAHCLGNAVFDQDRADTMLGLLAEVQQDGAELHRVHGIGVYIEDYRPKPMAGGLADRFLRRIGESSDPTVEVAVHGDRAWVLEPGEAVRQRRTLAWSVAVGPSGEAIVDLRDRLEPGESLAFARARDATSGRLGRDLLQFGDFEDDDVDGERFEAARWDLDADSRFTCLGGARSGVVGLCSTRADTNDSDSVVPFRNRIRVWGDGLNEPVKDLTLLGWTRGVDAGERTAVVRYSASVGEREHGQESFVLAGPGTHPWQRFAHDLAMPADTADPTDEEANPRALRLFLRHAPPPAGQGLAAFDDLAVVSWEDAGDLAAGVHFDVPHPQEFLRIEARPGPVRLDVELVRLVPPAVAE